ncbi:MAG: hypothetical protein PUP46_03060 [Endozoicomonas sp. (ex Botrylloides leachii)]|nr:hypothetical protein [Endozoicomonas sp. (ex Botrylloides leachii)]
MANITAFYFILLLLFIGIISSLLYWTLRLGISPTPTSLKVREKLVLSLPQSVNGEIHELGSGWGSLFSIISSRYPSHRFIAHERSPIPRWFSIITNRLSKKPVIITRLDIFSVDLSNAGLVICYLYPDAMRKLAKHLADQLPNNCWIISHTFHLSGWVPVTIDTANDLYKTPIYLYKQPGRHNKTACQLKHSA